MSIGKKDSRVMSDNKMTMERIREALIAGDGSRVKESTMQALAEGLSASELLNSCLMAGMDEVGRRMKEGEYFLPEVLLSARAMKMALEVLGPHLAVSQLGQAGHVMLGSVKGDLHDIGRNLVRMMLEGGGFKVTDLGSDVPPEGFAEAADSSKPDIVGMSCLLTTTMPEMKRTVEALRTTGPRGRVRTMVGGAVITQEFANQIGADAYAPDAASAVDKARELMRQG
jgi:5-methyltetrahydrofolate--homocysteine methyltransferase